MLFFIGSSFVQVEIVKESGLKRQIILYHLAEEHIALVTFRLSSNRDKLAPPADHADSSFSLGRTAMINYSYAFYTIYIMKLLLSYKK